MELNEIEVGMKVRAGTEIYTVIGIYPRNNDWVELTTDNSNKECLCLISALQKVHTCRLNRSAR